MYSFDTPIERLEISKLASFTILDMLGDTYRVSDRWNRMSDRWIRVISNPSTEKKLARYMNNVGIRLNVYFFISKDFDSAALDIESWNSKFSDYGIPKDSSAVNLIITNDLETVNDDLLPPTAWTILHMLCHFFYDGNALMWRNMWLDLLRKVYGMKFTYDVDTRYIMEKVFTFRSAQAKKLLNDGEGLIDLMTQIIAVGGSLDNFPYLENSGGIVHPTGLQYEYVDEFLKKFSKRLWKTLYRATGKYLFT